MNVHLFLWRGSSESVVSLSQRFSYLPKKTKGRCQEWSLSFHLCMILLSLLFSCCCFSLNSISVDDRHSEHTMQKKENMVFIPRHFFFQFKMCVTVTMPTCVIICMNCLDLHKAFQHSTVLLMHPSLDSVSVLMFTALPVCLCYGTKLMLHRVHIQTL